MAKNYTFWRFFGKIFLPFLKKCDSIIMGEDEGKIEFKHLVRISYIILPICS